MVTRDEWDGLGSFASHAHTNRAEVSLTGVVLDPPSGETLTTSSSRYFSPPPKGTIYPPEVHDYNDQFTHLLQNIKSRHDPTVTTVAQGVLEWKRKRGAGRIEQSIQEWLDRFYMSRIGIRFLIGQRECCRRR